MLETVLFMMAGGIKKGNMMKKLLLISMIIPSIAFAISNNDIDAIKRSHYNELEKMGLPTPDTGIQLVSKNELTMQKWQQEKYISESQELKSKGYVQKNSDEAQFLMNIKNEIRKIQPIQEPVYKPSDSHLRLNPNDIVFSYTYIGVPKSEMEEFYGIAPGGTYIKGEQFGWTGAIEFFKTNFAHCSYNENNMFISKGAVRIDEEKAKYLVNNKITLVDVEGNETTGYLYRVNWYDSIFNHDLQCASKVYSSEIKDKTIELAKKIDNQ